MEWKCIHDHFFHSFCLLLTPVHMTSFYPSTFTSSIKSGKRRDTELEKKKKVMKKKKKLTSVNCIDLTVQIHGGNSEFGGKYGRNFCLVGVFRVSIDVYCIARIWESEQNRTVMDMG